HSARLIARLAVVTSRFRRGQRDSIMDVEEIRAKIKEAISTVIEVDPKNIPDSAAYVEDLGLDSLAILEIAVHAEHQFKIKLVDEDFSKIRTIEDTVHCVRRLLPPG